MDLLMKLPCAKVFLDPVDPERDSVPTYLSVIKHPVDLTLIYKRLTGNEYTGISHWDKDMNFIWNNAEKFYPKASLIITLAAELHRRYSKEYQRVKMLRLTKWSTVVLGYRARLDQLFEGVPPFLGALASSQKGSAMKPLSEEELNVFIRMSRYLENAPDSKKMAQIVQHYQPETAIMGGSVELDVNDVNLQTLHALRDYVALRLGEMNIAYPR